MKYPRNHFKLYNSVFAAVALFAIISCGPAKNDSKQPPQLPEQQQTSSVNTDTEANLAEEIERQEVTAPPPETTEQATTAESTDEVMLNPPHGEPFHRCDIPVGAPLDSPPANNAVQSTTPQTSGSAPSVANNPMAPTIENAQRLNSTQPRNTTTTQNSGRINPPHGQPGHRCDIPVGSPLP